MKRIAVVTGTRAEYSYLKPLMTSLNQDKDFEMTPIITGMHLQSDFGNTYQLVEKDFPHSVKLSMGTPKDSLKDMATYLSVGIQNFTEYLQTYPPDILIVFGDRTEAFAAALSAFYLNIPIAHINGGDVSGTTIDESIRHAISKIAHIHFTHTKSNAERIKKMGEDKKRIFITGALTLDIIQHIKPESKDSIFKKYDLNPNETTFLVVQHPTTTLKDRGYSQMKELLQALDLLKIQTMLLYPNCDAGGKKFIELIKSYEAKEYMHPFKNLPHEDYLGIMNSVDLMIGNSSSGIIESPSFKIPVINIGNRQKGRARSDNILDVEPKKDQILKAINHALYDQQFQKKLQKTVNKFGDGSASLKIKNILRTLIIDEELIQKQITY